MGSIITKSLIRNKSCPIIISGILFIALLFPGIKLVGQNHPLGFKSYYSEACRNSNFMNSLTLSDSGVVALSKDRSFTQIIATSPDQQVDTLLPSSWGVISNLIFGEYIMDFEFRLPQESKGDQEGFYLLPVMKKCDTYYALGFHMDSVSFELVEKGKTMHLGTKGLGITANQWQKMRIKRDMLSRKIIISVNKEQIVFSDRKLVMGFIGFGVHNVNSDIRNISIWAPTAISDQIFNCE